MKKNIILWIGTLFLLIAGVGCEKETLPPHQAKGIVLGYVEGPCVANALYIEVENPKGIGLEGEGTFIGSRDWTRNYRNAIAVPLFHKIDLSADLMKGDTWLHFEYRELTEEDKNRRLFEPERPEICLWVTPAPPAKYYMITKIIAHKP